MKQIVIDELRPKDYEIIEEYMNETFGESRMPGIYWVQLPDDLLNETQKNHTECHPFSFAIELQPEKISFEMLVRTQNRVRCDCIAYADDRQALWLMQTADTMLEKLGIAI